MKIGTLTFHDTTNYGAILQAYALQKSIEKLGEECEIIDYKNETIQKRYEINSILKSKNVKEFIKNILTNNSKKKLKEKFEIFSKNYLKTTNQKYNRNSINQIEKNYKRIIVGSDQVWNLRLSGEDTTYMLDFIDQKEKKGSYAASFGYKEIPYEYKEITKKYLSEFDTLLVREEQGREIINSLIDRKSEVVLDPTLLLNQNEWNSIIQEKNKKEEFILLYIIAPNKEIINFAKKLAKKEKCKVIYINHSWKNVIGVKNKKDASPEEFLNYIKNAKYIVTTSFHGVAFSVNFNKQFYFALSHEKENFNSRIENLVKILGLENRLINKVDNTDIKINYDEVNEKLDFERNKSLQLLAKEVKI